MNIEVTVNIPALDRLVEVLKTGVSLPAVAAADAGKSTAAGATKNASRGSSASTDASKADAGGAADKPKTADTAAASTTSPTTSPSETAEDLLGKVKETAMVLSQKKGRDKLMDLLGEFGATNISGVPVDQHSAFIAEATSRAAA